jgi:hypothetical protein
MQRQPTDRAAHDLDHHDAVVRHGGRVEPVERLHNNGNSGVETESHIGLADVVVNGFGHADDGDAGLGHAGCHAQRAIPPDRNQGVYLVFFQDRLDNIPVFFGRTQQPLAVPFLEGIQP